MTKPIYQKYEIITKQDLRTQTTLSYLSHDITPVSETDSHLSPAVNYTMAPKRNRVILIVPSNDVGYQAASILSCQLVEYHEELTTEDDFNNTKDDSFDYDSKYDWDEVDEIFDDEIFDDGSNFDDDETFDDDSIYDDDETFDDGSSYENEWQMDALYSLGIMPDSNCMTPAVPVSPHDFRIIKQTPFDQEGQEGEETTAQIVMKPSNIFPDIPEKNVLLFCSANAQSATRMEEFLNLLMDKNLILVIRENEANSDFIENLQFKYGFDILKFKKPSLKQETAIFMKLLKQRGCKVSSSVNLTKVVQSLITYRDYHYEESDLECFANKMPSNKVLQEQDFSFYYYKKRRSGLEELEELIGQSKIKLAIHKIARHQIIEARRIQEQNADTQGFPLNFTFSGYPGTGKTKTARILARILHETSVRNGKFIEAGREDLVGKYLGHTSPAIAKLFKKAKGGVIFIDETDSLLSNDAYAQEAVSALVRHMENNQDTTVIFATYPDQMKAFLQLNPGLTSRISKNFLFQSYTNEELWKIFNLFAKKSGYAVDPGCKTYVTAFCEDARRREKKNFGNARVMRKLFQEANECSAWRIFNSGVKNPKYCITAADIKEAINYQAANLEQARVIGFVGTPSM